MKPRNQGGVVDSKLNVYGVEGLKICDMSIAPGNVSAVRHMFSYSRKQPHVALTEHILNRCYHRRKGGDDVR